MSLKIFCNDGYPSMHLMLETLNSQSDKYILSHLDPTYLQKDCATWS